MESGSRKASARARSGQPAKTNKKTVSEWMTEAQIWATPYAVVAVVIGISVAVAAYGAWIGDPARVVLCGATLVLLQVGVSVLPGPSTSSSHMLSIGERARLRTPAARRPLYLGCGLLSAGVVTALWLTVLTGLWWILPGAAFMVAVWGLCGNLRFSVGYMVEGLAGVVWGVAATAGAATILLGQVTPQGWWAAVTIGALLGAAVISGKLSAEHIGAARTLSKGLGLVGRAVACTLVLVPFVILGWVGGQYPAAAYGFLALLAAVPAGVIILLGRSTWEARVARRLIGGTACYLAIVLAVAYVR